MMSQSLCINVNHPAPKRIGEKLNAERGDALLEALIGILLIAVLGLGLAYAAGRTLNAQRYSTAHNIVLAEMRYAMETTGVKLCGSSFAINPTKLDGSKPIDLVIEVPSCETKTITVAVSGEDLSGSASLITQMQLSTTDDDNTKAQLGPGAITLKQ